MGYATELRSQPLDEKIGGCGNFWGWPLAVRRELLSRCGGTKRYDVSAVSGPRHGRPLVAALLLEMMTPVSAVGLLLEETAA